VDQCQLIDNTGFVEGLTALFKGTLNICSHRKVIVTKKAYTRSCEAMNLSLTTYRKRKQYVSYDCGEGF